MNVNMCGREGCDGTTVWEAQVPFYEPGFGRVFARFGLCFSCAAELRGKREAEVPVPEPLPEDSEGLERLEESLGVRSREVSRTGREGV